MAWVMGIVLGVLIVLLVLGALMFEDIQDIKSAIALSQIEQREQAARSQIREQRMDAAERMRAVAGYPQERR